MELKNSMLKADDTGLTSANARRRLSEYGENTLKKTKKISPLKIFLLQFKDLMTVILIVAIILSFFMGDTTEAIAILAIVGLNALIGFFQEYKTEKAIDALKGMSSPHSVVIRDGKKQTILSSELVPGDVVLVEAGDRVPADGVLTQCYNIFADESLLTGESLAVEKSLSGTDKDKSIFMGTVITKGRGRFIVTCTGMSTEMGKIAGMLDEIEEPKTPLQKRLDQLGKYIAIGCLVICAVVSITGILRGENIFDMVLMGISLAVAAVPEGLSAIVTIALALAVGRMVKKKALIKKLHAVETLGCSSIVCSDKTGTLTENKMTVRKIATYQDIYDVTGDGYEAKGDFLKGGQKVDVSGDKVLDLAFSAACLCNNGEVKKGKRGTKFLTTGDPTETGLLIACAKAGVTIEGLLKEYKKTDEIPFDSDRKLMSVITENSGRKILFSKGAPDIMLQKCTHVKTRNGNMPITSQVRNSILAMNEKMGSQALRVLAVAYRENPSGKNIEENLVFLGLFGMIDPPRKESYKAVEICKQAGIKPVMITGDHKITAKAIAADLKIFTEGDLVLTGQELDRMNEQEFMNSVQKTTVFARVSPRHKLKIVKAFKSLGHVVAMTGDGVNDAPAVKEADIGVSMGISGTDVTKEAAEVILLDDNFATIISAIEEGRVIYKNIRKFIRYLISCNVGEVMTMFVGMLFSFPVILLPIQILWVNLVTDGFPAIALGLEPPEGDEMEEKPRSSKESVFSGGMVHRIILRGLIITLCTVSVFALFFMHTGDVAVARTGAFLMLVLTQLIHVFECKSEKKSLIEIPIFSNKWLILAALFSLSITLFAIYSPIMQGIFKTVALTSGQILHVVLIALMGSLVSGIFTAGKAKAKKKGGVIISVPGKGRRRKDT